MQVKSSHVRFTFTILKLFNSSLSEAPDRNGFPVSIKRSQALENLLTEINFGPIFSYAVEFIFFFRMDVRNSVVKDRWSQNTFNNQAKTIVETGKRQTNMPPDTNTPLLKTKPQLKTFHYSVTHAAIRRGEAKLQ